MKIGRPLIVVRDRLSRRERRQEYQEFWRSMMPFVCESVVKSFFIEHTQHPTRSAVKERVDICKGLVDQLRNEFVWSRVRIRDHLTLLLRARLNGEQIDLEFLARRSSW